MQFDLVEKEVCDNCPVWKCFETGRVEEAQQYTPDKKTWLLKAFPLKDMSGKVTHVIQLASEITETLRLQRDSEQAQRLASLGELTVGLAHEINNPSGILALNTKSLGDFFGEFLPQIKEHLAQAPGSDSGDTDWKEFLEELPAMLEDMEHSARKIGRIVKDLKGFANQDNLANHELLDFNKVVQVSVRLAANAIKNTTDRFGIALHSALPKITGCAVQLEQVVLNLIINACQALPDRDRALRVSTGLDEMSGQVTLRVEDQGEGMSLYVMRRIKEPFFTTKRQSGGTGLGLSIAMRIINEHQGEMKFVSEPGAGTVAMVYLPVCDEVNLQ